MADPRNPFDSIVNPQTTAAPTPSSAPVGRNPFAAIVNPEQAVEQPTSQAAAPQQSPGLPLDAPRGPNAPWWWRGPGNSVHEFLGIPETPDNGASLGETAKAFALNLPGSLRKHAVQLFDTVKNAVTDTLSDPLGMAHKAAAEIPELPHELLSYGAGMTKGLVTQFGGINALKKTAAEDPAAILIAASQFVPIGKVTGLNKAIEKGGAAAAGTVDAIVGTANGIQEGALQKMFAKGEKITPSTWSALTGGIDWDHATDVLGNMTQSLIRQRGDNYLSEMAKLKSADKPVDFTKVNNAVNDAAKVGYYKAPGDLSPGPGIRLDDSKAVQKARGQILAKVTQWENAGPEYHTAIGFDSLKQSIAKIEQDLRGTGPLASPESVFASKIKNAVRQTIIDNAPAYGDVMKKYESDTNGIENIHREFKSGDESRKLQAIKSLQQVLTDKAGVGHEVKSQMLQGALEQTGNADLMDQLLGNAYHPWMPKGLRKAFIGAEFAGSLGRLWHEPMSGLVDLGLTAGSALAMSPRVAGSTAYGLGRIAPTLRTGRDAVRTGVKTGLGLQDLNPPPQQAKGGYFAR